MAGLMLVCFGLRSLLLAWVEAPAGGNAPAPSLYDGRPASLVERLDRAEKVERLLTFAATLEGSPYRAAGEDPQGFDCSGFVQYAFREALGIKLPRSSRDMARTGKAVALAEAQPGDLLVFTGSNRGSGRIGHVALVVASDHARLMMIHTSSSRGVITEDMHQLAYYAQRFRQVRRLDL